MKIIDDEAQLSVKIDAAQPITVNVQDQHKIDVVIGDAAKMDCQKAINYIQSGKAEIESAVETGIGNFNSNAELKTSEFNTNATNKTNAFNSNATLQTTYFNDNAVSKTNDFNDNYTAKKALIDAEVGVAKQWAIGDPTEPTGGSSKYWADQASSTVGNCANKDLSNLSTTGEAKFVKPSELATVATTGSYNDLLNKPTIPAAQVNSDWNAVSGVAEILNKPTIPTVNDATLTITQGGVSKGTFTANASSDVTIDLDAGGGASRNIGEIVQSTIPLTDAGLHLLDGSLILGGGIYDDFVTYISGLTSTYPDLFCSEADWQASNTAYGACDKFVYDSVNSTVRLPKRTSEHGALIKSYSSGTDWYRVYSDGWCEQGGTTTMQGSTVTQSLMKEYKDTNYLVLLTCGSITNNWPIAWVDNNSKTTSSFLFDGTGDYTQAARTIQVNWRTCGYVDISDYQYSPVYEYIVIATSVKTQIEVDIDEIATDLNGKADVDLSNSTVPHIVETYVSGASWYRIWSDGWCEQGGSYASTSTDYGQQTISLLKPYEDANYDLQVTIINTWNNFLAGVGIGIYSKTSLSFVVAPQSSGYGGHGGNWMACGYIGE